MGAWPAIERIGLAATGVTTAAVGLTAVRAATMTNTDSLRMLFGGGGLALVLAALLLILRRREDLVAVILGGITAATFGIGLAELTVLPVDDRYQALWPAVPVAACLLAFLAFRGAFARGPVTSRELRRLLDL